MSIDLNELRDKLALSKRQKGPIPALEMLFEVIGGILQYLEEQESYRLEMKERE